jgi:hypothetical protein
LQRMITLRSRNRVPSTCAVPTTAMRTGST